jgi:PhnB protein
LSVDQSHLGSIVGDGDRSDEQKGRTMAGSTPPTPYLHFGGTAREALSFYADVFGGSAQLNTFEDFNRTDGRPEAIAHGGVTGGPVQIFAADVAGDERPFRCEGMMFSLLGTADPATLKGWFSKLSEGGQVVDDLQRRPWGASDGQVIDRYGLHWLIGFEEVEPN